MSLTNIKSSPVRIEKDLQISTFTGRYHLNVPGPGANVNYESDPHIRLQKWGANYHTNTVNLESDLIGLTRSLNRDCNKTNNYLENRVKSVQVPSGTNNPYTEQSRAIMPAWTARDLEQSKWEILPLNPQEHVCIPFHNNLSTRILEKDYYTPNVPCVKNNTTEALPVQNFMNGNSALCKTRSCSNI